MKRSTRRRAAVLPLLAVAAAIGWLVLGPKMPAEQTVHVVLGAAAPDVREVRIRYAPASDPEAWDREVALRYEPRSAPRIVTHSPRLPNGAYRADIEVFFAARADAAAGAPESRVRVERKITLEGGSVSIELPGGARPE